MDVDGGQGGDVVVGGQFGVVFGDYVGGWVDFDYGQGGDGVVVFDVGLGDLVGGGMYLYGVQGSDG